MYKILKTLYILFDYNTTFFKLVCNLLDSQIKRFIESSRDNRLLLADLTLSHGEILPGLVKYSLDLGYDVDILITNDKMLEKPLNMFKTPRVRVFPIITFIYTHLLSNSIIKDYKRVIFGSARIYRNIDNEDLPLTIKVLTNVITPKPIGIEHHLECLNQEEFEKMVPAGLPIFSEEKGIKMVNTHYFGDYPVHKKNKKTRFVVLGNIENQRKNHNVLIDGVKELINKNITNFDVIVIGRGKFDVQDKTLSKKIKCLGRVSYERMYKEINKSDYILALLDSENPLHERYINDGTSGTFQLVYGFKRPCIIDKKFAKPHGLNENNSILYSGNDKFSQALEEAVFLNKEQYDKKVTELADLSQEIYKKSLNNLKELIEV